MGLWGLWLPQQWALLERRRPRKLLQLRELGQAVMPGAQVELSLQLEASHCWHPCNECNQESNHWQVPKRGEGDGSNFARHATSLATEQLLPASDSKQHAPPHFLCLHNYLSAGPGTVRQHLGAKALQTDKNSPLDFQRKSKAFRKSGLDQLLSQTRFGCWQIPTMSHSAPCLWQRPPLR